jgi:hypothetical protein
VARLLVVLAAFAGLFAMHGMSEHGVMRHGDVAMAGMQQALSPVTESLVDTSAAVLAEGATRVVDAAALVTANDPGQGTGAAMALCLAILAGLTLALGRGRRSSIGVALSAWTHPQSVRLVSRARVPDPPDLFALSVQRC